eukprot:ANDGO_04141.mRNA.1 hypothetical protein
MLYFLSDRVLEWEIFARLRILCVVNAVTAFVAFMSIAASLGQDWWKVDTYIGETGHIRLMFAAEWITNCVDANPCSLIRYASSSRIKYPIENSGKLRDEMAYFRALTEASFGIYLIAFVVACLLIACASLRRFRLSTALALCFMVLLASGIITNGVVFFTFRDRFLTSVYCKVVYPTFRDIACLNTATNSLKSSVPIEGSATIDGVGTSSWTASAGYESLAIGFSFALFSFVVCVFSIFFSLVGQLQTGSIPVASLPGITASPTKLHLRPGFSDPSHVFHVNVWDSEKRMMMHSTGHPATSAAGSKRHSRSPSFSHSLGPSSTGVVSSRSHSAKSTPQTRGSSIAFLSGTSNDILVDSPLPSTRSANLDSFLDFAPKVDDPVPQSKTL